MKSKLFKFLGLFFVCFFLLQTFALAMPKRARNYVNDYADILNLRTENELNSLFSSLEKQTTAEVAVVTVNSLDNMPIEKYASLLFEKWGIGKKDKDNGVLFLIAPRNRKMRIEVGYGLEGALPDGLVGGIRDKYILPYFKIGDFDKGVLEGSKALVSYIAKEYNVDAPVNSNYTVVKTKRRKGSLIGNIFSFLLLLLLISTPTGRMILLFILLRNTGYYSRGGGSFGSGFGGFGGGLSGGGGASGSW